MICDMDNVEIGTCPIDAKSRFLQGYENERGIDSATDPYMLNVSTVGLLDNPFGEVYFETVGNLINQAPREYLLPEAINILDSMTQPSKFTGEYIAPYIKLPNHR